MTNDLVRRVNEHREGKVPGFTKRYKVLRLVFYEQFQFVEDAIQREKTLKHWLRDWKINLIERDNPHWSDLYPELRRRAEHPTIFGALAEMDPRDKPEDDTGNR